MLRWVLLALSLVVVALAIAPNDAELMELNAAKDTVLMAQKDLDVMDSEQKDSVALSLVNTPVGMVNAKAAEPDLGEALMKEDSAPLTPVDTTDAAVEVEALANNLVNTGSDLGEAADPKDVSKVFDLAKTLKQSGKSHPTS